MPRAKRILTASFPYHVTGRTNNRDWFLLPISEVWQIFGWMLARVSTKYQAEVISFVLMSNHYHLILLTPRANLNEIMNSLLREVSRAIGPRTGRMNHLFGGRYKASLLPDSRSLGHVYKYVYRNPVTAGICAQVQDYEFSTLKSVLGGRPLFPLYESEIFARTKVPKDHGDHLEWLNTPFSPRQYDLIKKGLRRSKFQLSTQTSNRRIVNSLPEF